MFSSITSTLNWAGSTAKQYGQAVYKDLTAHPTEIKCSNPGCQALIPVPESVWDWKCSLGHVNKDKDEICKQCPPTHKRPNVPSPDVVCKVCTATTSVPITNAGKQVGVASEVAKQTMKTTKKYAVDKYTDWSSRPCKVLCEKDSCSTEVVVPPEIWIWTCQNDHKSDISATTCEECNQVRPKDLNPRVVTCVTCGTMITVPDTNAQVYVTEVAKKTKEVVVTAKGNATEKYDHLKSRPSEFNCSGCNTILNVPQTVTWLCRTEGCGKTNASGTRTCTLCHKTPIRQAMCGQCGMVSNIPISNFSNSIRSSKNVMIQGYTAAVSGVSTDAIRKNTSLSTPFMSSKRR